MHLLGPVFLEADPKTGRHNLLLALPLLPCIQSHIHLFNALQTVVKRPKTDQSSNVTSRDYVAQLIICSRQASVQVPAASISTHSHGQSYHTKSACFGDVCASTAAGSDIAACAHGIQSALHHEDPTAADVTPTSSHAEQPARACRAACLFNCIFCVLFACHRIVSECFAADDWR